MLTENEIVLELESIQHIMVKKFASDSDDLNDALGYLRISVQYIMLDNDSLKRELKYAKQKKSKE